MPASRLASAIRRQLGAPHDHPLDPEAAARRLGYAVVWAPPQELGPVDGMVIRDELHVAHSGIATRDRWTLAHELAHAEARRHGMDWRDDRLADLCAAELLIPSHLLSLHLRRDLDLPAIAAWCGVSCEATARRAIELAPGLAVTTYDRQVRTYSSLPTPSRRLARLGVALARRSQEGGRPKRIRLSTWVARGWSHPDAPAGVAVILRG